MLRIAVLRQQSHTCNFASIVLKLKGLLEKVFFRLPKQFEDKSELIEGVGFNICKDRLNLAISATSFVNDPRASMPPRGLEF